MPEGRRCCGYGNARELALGARSRPAVGRNLDAPCAALRKDNTGYALRDLFIGAEGTLGVITAALPQNVSACHARR
jgi:FAD/FMN-containing dehydrogenase